MALFSHYEAWGHTVAALAVGSLILGLTMCSAQAQTTMLPPAAKPGVGVLPPVEYDKPFTGKLKMIRGDRFLMSKLCPKVVGQPVTLGCSYRSDDGSECVVIMAEDGLIYDAGWTPQIVYRHERGHCLSWGGDHKGARPCDDSCGPPKSAGAVILPTR